MSSTIRGLVLSCLALLPFEVGAQTMPAMPADLGLIPEGEERAFELRGVLNLETATQEQAMAAVQRTMFSIAETSGFCISLSAPAEPTMLFLVGREMLGSPVLFDVNTSPTGISNADGKRSILRTISPIPQTTFLLAAVVGQTSTAPGDTLNVIVRTYPDTMPQETIDAICGPGLGS
jgi:hypothetical protein